jgi:tRNA-specific 2-thiouridylase
MEESVKDKKIFVGLSGGVDSAVTAALLKQAGAKVTGVFIKGWYPQGLPCTWSEDRRDAMRVAAHLGIPFVTLDASREYKKAVIDYLISEYRAGRTPNPDVMCNRDVKFGVFYEFARDHSADFIATGHYARTGRDVKCRAVGQRISRLMRGADEAKDQSYFLWAVPKNVLPHVLFPLGGMKKTEVRELAAKFELPVAVKRDSQGVCFLGPVSVADFLRHEIGAEPGAAVDGSGATVGRHEGALLSTLGERVALAGAAPGPWYVLAKDLEANTLTVGHEPELPGVQGASFSLSHPNLFDRVSDGELLSAQYRYHGPHVMGRYDEAAHRFIPVAPVTEPVSKGQSLVMYRGDELIGGGIIE